MRLGLLGTTCATQAEFCASSSRPRYKATLKYSLSKAQTITNLLIILQSHPPTNALDTIYCTVLDEMRTVSSALRPDLYFAHSHFLAEISESVLKFVSYHLLAITRLLRSGEDFCEEEASMRSAPLRCAKKGEPSAEGITTEALHRHFPDR